MSVLAASMQGYLGNSSWIRRMFELGTQLKQQYGEDQVYDFSLGNPDLPAPPIVGEALKEVAERAADPFTFGYMSNGGFPWLRKKLADHLSKEQGVPLKAEDVLLSCGAAGALNAFLRATLDPGSEVLTFAPYFVEYGFYCENHGGCLKAVPSHPDTFAPDLEALEHAINPSTRAVLINSPHNPTGVIYSRKDLAAIAHLLENKSQEFGRPIWLIADEPYRFLAYDGAVVPSVLPLYKYSVVVSSLSKNMSLPGERVGYIALSPNLKEKEELMAGLTLANRILGFVNPPVIGQYILDKAMGHGVELEIYAQRRAAMAEVLRKAGYEFLMPQGAFYFFPKAPGGNDVAFVDTLLKQRILAVPGSGFGMPGYFRLAFCVDEDVIRNAAEGFANAMAESKGAVQAG